MFLQRIRADRGLGFLVMYTLKPSKRISHLAVSRDISQPAATAAVALLPHLPLLPHSTLHLHSSCPSAELSLCGLPSQTGFKWPVITFDQRPVGADAAQTQADRQTPLQIQIYEPMCRRGRRRKRLTHAGRPAQSLCCQL